MRENNKKGFTIVELVIVIAVIAILAAVLIPNLSRLVGKANESKAMQQAKAAYEAYLVDHAKEMDDMYFCIASDGHYYHVVAGQFDTVEKTACPTVPTGKTLKYGTVANGVLTVSDTAHTHTQQ